MDPRAPDRKFDAPIKEGERRPSRLRRRVPALSGRHRSSPWLRRKRARWLSGNQATYTTKPSKTGGTAEGPAFRPGRTKAGYVFFGPGTRPKESGGTTD